MLQRDSIDKSSTQSDSANQSSTSDTSQPSTEQVASGTTIIFTNDGFNPRTYTTKVNQTVTVKNDSSTDVQFSSDDHPSHRDETELNLRTLSPGESATFAPTKVGTWGFHDHIQDSFTGTLTVTN